MELGPKKDYSLLRREYLGLLPRRHFGADVEIEDTPLGWPRVTVEDVEDPAI